VNLFNCLHVDLITSAPQ